MLPLFRTDKPKLLDCCCKAGGASMGYAMAGFEVIGIDIEDQPNYPFTFYKGDVLEVLADKQFTDCFDIIVASPPCQYYTKLKYLSNNVEQWEENHVNLIPQVRELLIKTGKPYIIENVAGAPLSDPIKLFGSQFPNMYTQRERWFESNMPLRKNPNPIVKHKTGKLGQGFGEDGWISVVGERLPKGMNEVQTRLYYGFALGGIDWMSIKEMTQCVPPCYTEFLGKQAKRIIELDKNKQIRDTVNRLMSSVEFREKVKEAM